MKRIVFAVSIAVLVSAAARLFAPATVIGQQVMTVLGPIPVEKLGMTLTHEHAAFGYLSWFADESVAPYDQKQVETRWVKILNELKALGVQTVIDPAPADTGGRDPIVQRNASKKTGVQIIMATGLYWEAEGGAMYYEFLQARGRNIEQDIYELFMREITVGIGKSGVKAGIIKLASSDPKMTEYEKIVFKAGVRAAEETGLPITTHCEGPNVGPEQMDFFLSLGANPEKIIIGHQNNSTDLNYFLDQLKRPGFYLGFDRTGFSDPKAEDCIIELVKRGYANRIVLSHDYVATWLGRPFKWTEGRFTEEYYYPTYIHKQFIPRMKAAGVTDEQIHTMMVENPRRLFAAK
jgi:phosphotriesterase-related protein